MIDPAPTHPRSARRFRDLQLVQLTLVRLREFFREPEALFWVFIFPILLAGGLGLAFRSKPADTVKVAVVQNGAASQRLFSALEQNPSLLARTLDDVGAQKALRTGDVALVAKPSGEASVEYRFDPTRPDARTALQLVDAAVQRAAGRTDPIAVTEVKVSERGARYIDFLLPGLLGMNLMGSGIWGLGFALVDLRRKKLLKRLMATPMSKAQFLASFLLSRMFLLVFEVAALVGFGMLVFDVPLRGSILELSVLVICASLTFGGMGLLISSRVTTMEGASGLMNLVMLPMWIFSGVFFSAANFPDSMQPLIRLLPLTAVNEALRAQMLQGTPLTSLGPQFAVITAWMLASYLLALRFFRWR